VINLGKMAGTQVQPKHNRKEEQMSTYIKFKKLSKDAVTPKKASTGAAAFDLVAVRLNREANYWEYETDIAFEVPPGWVAKLYARSSCSNQGLCLANGVGIIDSDFRGGVKVRYYIANDLFALWKPGEAVAQIIFERLPDVTLVESEHLTTTERGEGGFGSTDTKED